MPRGLGLNVRAHCSAYAPDKHTPSDAHTPGDGHTPSHAHGNCPRKHSIRQDIKELIGVFNDACTAKL